MKTKLLVLIGAMVGAVVGYFGFMWLVHQGFYALVLPGGLVGLGAGLFRNDSWPLALICGALALILGFFCEWRFAPFIADHSLGYFLAHVSQLRPMTLIMIALGAGIGFWVPFRRINPQPIAG
jgi:hypothetical protein